jgi:1-acyl-sn-glycerol-3-phosphate acyltransferase
MWLIEKLGSPVDPEVDAALAQIPNRTNELGYDPWGLSLEESRHSYTIAKKVYDYFKPEVTGIENVPEGRVLIVPNHSGQLPMDGLIVQVAALLHARPPRLLRPMVERWVPKLPFVNEAFSRAGVVLGDPVNCRNLLCDDQAILVFPEGVRGSGKPWPKRYQLQYMGRGFMRLALETRTPIVPCAVIGGEESILSLGDWKGLARLLGFPYFPVHPLLPILGPLAYVPMPVKFYLHFGAPMHFEGPFDDEDAVIDAKVSVVKDRLQSMIKEGVATRPKVFAWPS